jgi:hypothetical protein
VDIGLALGGEILEHQLADHGCDTVCKVSGSSSQPGAGNSLDDYSSWTLMDKSSFTTTVITLRAHYLAISCLK